MKCWHLVAAAALSLAACGLNSAPVAQAGSELDAGTSDSAVAADMGGQSTTAGSPASWPVRRRSPSLVRDKKDGGSADTKGAGGKGASGSPSSQGGAASPGSSTTDPGQVAPGSGGKNPATGSVSGGQDAGSKPSSGSPTPDAGSGSSGHSDAGKGNGHGGNKDDKGDKNGQNDKGGDKGHGSDKHDSDEDDDESNDPDSTHGGSHGSQGPSSGGSTVGGIADLVLAIVDLSLTGSPPALQQLVSAILVLSLSPVDLAADSLTQVLDALASTRICQEDPEHCDPLCEDLEKECKVCDGDEDCIAHIEETCKVHLPDWCY